MQELLDTTDTSEWRAKYVSLCAPETSVFENAETVAGDLFDAAVQGQKFSFRLDSENASRSAPVYILSAGENDLLRLNAAYDKASRAWKVEPAPLGALHAEARTLTITVPEGTAAETAAQAPETRRHPAVRAPRRQSGNRRAPDWRTPDPSEPV